MSEPGETGYRDTTISFASSETRAFFFARRYSKSCIEHSRKLFYYGQHLNGALVEFVRAIRPRTWEGQEQKPLPPPWPFNFAIFFQYERIQPGQFSKVTRHAASPDCQF
jgi:hypothetical protein